MNVSSDRRGPGTGAEPAPAWTLAQRRYGEIQAALMRSQTDAYVAAQTRLNEAQRNYLAGIQNLHEELSSRYREAHQQYTTGVIDAVSSATTEATPGQAQAAFEQSAAAVIDELRTRSERLATEMAGMAAQASHAYEAAVRDAYRAFLQSQRDFWLELNIDELVPGQ
jgi:phage-related tail protein